MIKFLLAILLCLYLVLAKEGVGDSIIVSLKQGKIEGFEDVSTEEKKFYTFLKVPYAKPPIGNLRFQEPQPPEEWTGVRNGKVQPPLCAQINYLQLLSEYTFGKLGKEDCLFVNIFTREVSGQSDLPVMVYIHGGGYVGSGIAPVTPHDLLNDDIVLVTVQYRLGLLGFIWTEDSVTPSNLGLKDQTMALKWVRENINKFGGDENKVTIFGQSAGAGSVHAHLLSDYSNGLFSRAILQSGTLLCPWAKMTRPRETAMKVGDHLGCFNSNNQTQGIARSQQLLSCLKNADLVEILKITKEFFEWSFLPKRTVPYVDGDFFQDEIETMVRKAKIKPVDVIYGVTRDEGSFVSNAMLVLEEQRRAIKDNFDIIGPMFLAFEREENAIELALQACNLYLGGIKNDLEDYYNLTMMLGEHHFQVCSDVAAIFHSKLNAKARKNTFFYELHYKGNGSLLQSMKDPPMARGMISHGDELFHLFPGFLGTNLTKSDQDKKVSSLLCKMWTNFAKHGDPTPDMSLGFKWEPFSEDSPRHLKITLEPSMEDDLRKEKREFWKSLNTRNNRLLYKEAKEEL